MVNLKLLALASAVGAVGSATPSIRWTDCPESPSDQFRCTNHTVPLDWANPHGRKINLGMAMMPATNKSQRIGYLLFNPGGPGNAATTDLMTNSDIWEHSKLHQYFDIVALDPRGTGQSTPIQCDPHAWNVRVPEFPRTPAQYHEMTQAYRAMGQSCAKKSGDLLNFVDTASVAKDFEAVRVALGDEKLTYLGFSYGTQLGSQYLELFPDNVRAAVLDGVLDHSQPEIYAWESEALGYEVTLNRFLHWCATDRSCALHNTTRLPAKFDSFIDRANRAPIPAPSCSDFSSDNYPCRSNATGHEILRNLQAALIFPYDDTPEYGPGWAAASASLRDAMFHNDSSSFSYPVYSEQSNSDFSYVSIVCQDWLRAQWSADDFFFKVLAGEAMTPHTRGQGEFWYLQAKCLHWPAPVTNPPRELTSAFANRTLDTPVLLTNALYDPETPFQWALSVKRQFGDRNAVLVARNGSGHLSYFHKGDTRDAIDDYLIGLKVPKSGTVLQS
ncbi:alpha/beta-hydrolase [Aspergillus candidus]|uniref:Alpha/beta-hydrolase n=1 Tax=Aspergillus candidus TaxID=41067 RepID=A0A2I2FBZ5_ASPCN|nr:alpha/beta-hydrolase [Aspergillus candidus]PLB38137.1 alpha/beta-hydrolase [Aspergillus candidus]